jgi:murein DD-endopeptidase MepM/ murein hydrolase activator NlpD
MVSLTISKRIGNAVFLAIFIILSLLGTGTVYVWRRQSDLAQLTRLEKENALLRESMTNFTNQMDSLLIKIRIMEEWEDHLRQERRLRVINPDVRALGSGGEPYIDPSFLPFCIALHETYNDALSRLNYLSAKIALTYETHFDLLMTLQSRELIYKTTPSIWPTFGRITSNYGYRTHPVFNYRIFHAGIDIANERGTVVYATAYGTVSFAGRSGQSGNLIRIEHASGLQTRYAHLDRILVTAGQTVHKGQIIATMGMSGVSTGFHLHYEIFDVSRRMAVNPINYMSLTENQISMTR